MNSLLSRVCNLRHHIKDFVAAPIRRIQGEQREFLALPDSQRTDWEVILAMLTAAVMLTVQHYCVTGQYSGFVDKILHLLCPSRWDEALTTWMQRDENHELVRLSRWTLGNVFVYVLGPVLVIKCVLRKKLSDYGAGFKWEHLSSGWKIYLLLFLFMLPAIYLASLRKEFQTYYPFYSLAKAEPLWPRFIIWEVFYAGQFVALEFFFRGFLLHALRKRFGIYAIFVSTIPYCMIHFGKPMPETFGAIGAGIVLGFMSLKTRSIWLGAALHITVAWTMDTLAVINIMSR